MKNAIQNYAMMKINFSKFKNEFQQQELKILETPNPSENNPKSFLLENLVSFLKKVVGWRSPSYFPIILRILENIFLSGHRLVVASGESFICLYL